MAAPIQTMRPSTLATLGLGTPLEAFQRGRLPVDTATLVDQVFGPAHDRGCLVISGANGIVGAGKVMQFASRLQPYGVTVVGLDMPNAPDGIGQKYAGLVASFGPEAAARIMGSLVLLKYDGKTLPPALASFKPRFLLEAIPEILDVKRAHYETFRAAFPGIEIRSVTSGFPSRELGVGVAHPAFPHEINKVFEIVEEEPSAITQLLWSLGLLPMEVGDHWAFVLDVLFCGVTLAALRYHETSNTPYWKIDKWVRKYFGPNPLRAHDAIGAKGANFLTWSCLHHLGKEYGPLFVPTADLTERKDTGQNWYPPNHFRPLVDWALTSAEEDTFRTAIAGPIIQMTALMVHENRAHLTQLNAIGELCAQFRSGVLAMIRSMGAEKAKALVEAYHVQHPEAAASPWHAEALDRIHEPAWQQLYVNAEHDGHVGLITLSRESYNSDVDAELNRAITWLKAAKIDRVILSGDLHLSTQMVGADTSEFYPALDDERAGQVLAERWSTTARRLHTEFATSVGVITGKRCLGGMLELMTHCHFLVAAKDTQLGFPEVTLPVVPGMEACHWPFRKAKAADWPKLMTMLLSGKAVRAEDAVGWLVDACGSVNESLATGFAIASGTATITRRPVAEGALTGIPTDVAGLRPSEGPSLEAGRKAIADCVVASCGAPLADAVTVQAAHSAAFMKTAACRKGRVGSEFTKTMVG
jgi:enoyl-CoA hydratase/carnithine racemase/3-hydroxyacyl-CoA dehydrogenase